MINYIIQSFDEYEFYLQKDKLTVVQSRFTGLGDAIVKTCRNIIKKELTRELNLMMKNIDELEEKMADKLK